MDAPGVAVSDDGKQVMVAWMDMRDGRNDRSVFWAPFNGRSFSPETSVAADSADIQAHPSVCADEKGVFHVVFEDLKQGKRILHRTSAKDSRDEPITDASEGECSFPSLARAGERLGVAYESGGGVSFRVVTRAEK